MGSAFDVTRFSSSGQNVIQVSQADRRRGDCRDARLSSQAPSRRSRFHGTSRKVPPGQAQSDDADAEMRIQRLESQLRQLTGQNEELQYRNRQLEERLRQLGGGAAAPGGRPPGQPNVAAVPPAQPAQSYGQPHGPGRHAQPQAAASPQAYAAAAAAGYPQRRSQPRADRAGARRRRRRGAAAAMPSIPARTRMRPARRTRSAAASCRCRRSTVGAPGGRGAGEPLDLAGTANPRRLRGGAPQPRRRRLRAGAKRRR